MKDEAKKVLHQIENVKSTCDEESKEDENVYNEKTKISSKWYWISVIMIQIISSICELRLLPQHDPGIVAAVGVLLISCCIILILSTIKLVKNINISKIKKIVIFPIALFAFLIIDILFVPIAAIVVGVISEALERNMICFTLFPSIFASINSLFIDGYILVMMDVKKT